jgi:hypothetical protein
MAIGERLKEKSRGVADSIKRQYRQQIGDSLAEKAQSLTDRKVSLQLREKEISEREKRLAKYYFIPRIWIQIPVFAALCIAAYFAYQAVQPLLQKSGVGAAPSESHLSTSSVPDYSACVGRGTKYYKAIGTYPTLSTGEDADSKVRQTCGNNGFAFPE